VRGWMGLGFFVDVRIFLVGGFGGFGGGVGKAVRWWWLVGGRLPCRVCVVGASVVVG
jgi:hypothetical protein